MASKIPVAGSSITYGQFRKAGQEWSEEQTLAQVAEAGYDGAPAGPRQGRSAAETVALYAKYGLKCAPGYLGAEWWNPEHAEKNAEAARRQAAFAREAGLDTLYVAPGGFNTFRTRAGKTRGQVAGRVKPDDGLTDDQYQLAADALNECGRLTLAEGVMSCFHNHVGTVIETRAECDKLLALCDPKLVYLGPDTGHLAWGGADVVDFFRTYAPRIKTVHLKDVYPDVLRRCQQGDWDYGQTTEQGLWAELGEGMVDFRAIFDILSQHDYDGWIVAEIDRTTKPTALDSLKASRAGLRAIGI